MHGTLMKGALSLHKCLSKKIKHLSTATEANLLVHENMIKKLLITVFSQMLTNAIFHDHT